MKKYVLNLYKTGNLLRMIPFDNLNDINNEDLREIKYIDKIRLFELNNTKDGRNLIKEYKINNFEICDDILFHEDTKILGYEIHEGIAKSLYFRIKFKMSEEVRLANDLWHGKRYIDVKLIKSKADETDINFHSAALVN